MTAWSHTFSWGCPGTRVSLCCCTSPEMCSTACWYSSLAKLQKKKHRSYCWGSTLGGHITRLGHKTLCEPRGDVETSCQLPRGLSGRKSRLAGCGCSLRDTRMAEITWLQTSSASQTAAPGAPNVSSSCRSAWSSCAFPRELS